MKKTNKKVDKKAKVSKNTKKVEKPKEPIKQVKKSKPKTKSKTKDIIIICILSLIIIILIIFAFMTPTNEKPNDDVVIDDENISDINMEELEARVKTLQENISKDIVSEQLLILESFYEPLDLNEQEMKSCLALNDFTVSENFENDESKYLIKIDEDYTVAYMLGISSTPTMFLNGYKIEGYKTYEEMSALIEQVLEETPLDLSSANEYLPNKDNNRLIIITNENNDEYKKNYDLLMKQVYDYNFFKNLFEVIDIEEIDYKSDLAKDIIKTENVQSLPYIYLEADYNTLIDIKPELESEFNSLFYPVNENAYMLYLPYYYQYLYPEKSILGKNDYIMGSEDVNLSLFLFTDYFCAYSKMFSEETLPLLKDNYIDTNKMNFIVKDYFLNSEAITPIIFSRCAQEQEKYYETYMKIYEQSDILGSLIVDKVLQKYDAEINEINEIYEQMNS